MRKTFYLGFGYGMGSLFNAEPGIGYQELGHVSKQNWNPKTCPDLDLAWFFLRSDLFASLFLVVFQQLSSHPNSFDHQSRSVFENAKKKSRGWDLGKT